MCKVSFLVWMQKDYFPLGVEITKCTGFTYCISFDDMGYLIFIILL